MSSSCRLVYFEDCGKQNVNRVIYFLLIKERVINSPITLGITGFHDMR